MLDDDDLTSAWLAYMVPVNPRDFAPRLTAGDYVDKSRSPIAKSKQGSGCGMRDDCFLAAGKHCGEQLSVLSNLSMPKGKYTPEDWMELPSGYATGNDRPGHAQRVQLRPRHDAMLVRREGGDLSFS